MGAFRRVFGIDAVDFAIQLGVTMFVMVLFDEASHNDAFIGAIGAISLVVLGVRRQRALARQSGAEFPEDRAAELDARLAELDELRHRVLELEERVDFAERLLAQGKAEPARLEARP
jgi:hypothetical protein